MPGEDAPKPGGVECAALDELEQAGFVLGASGLEGDSGGGFFDIHVSNDSDCTDAKHGLRFSSRVLIAHLSQIQALE
jgi:hypothetical protein